MLIFISSASGGVRYSPKRAQVKMIELAGV